MPGGHAILFYRDHSAGGGTIALSSGLDRAVLDAYRVHYSRINPMRPVIAVRPAGSVFSVDQMISPEEFRRTEFYHDFLRPLGVVTGFGVTLRRLGACSFDFVVMGGRLPP